MRWALVLVCNLNYISKAFETIIAAREQGKWVDDIVLVVPKDVYEKAQIRQIAMNLGIEFLVLPEDQPDNLMDFWDKYKEHSNYEYVSTKKFQYYKFYLMHPFFKKWTNIFYVDAGIKIHGPLSRLTNKCTERKVLYAHSDAFPYLEWKLAGQFNLELDEEMAKKLKASYNLNINYFQSTVMLYDTEIIKEDTVSRLFYLKDQFPFSFRNDQGIFNLYFVCEHGLWRQIPILDEQGYLYDYHNRPGIEKGKYLMLKAYH